MWKWIKKSWKEILIDTILIFFVIFIIIASAILIWISTLQIPDLDVFEERQVKQSTKIYDRSGEILLYDLHQDVRRTNIDFEEISHHLQNATLAIEDADFYNHAGISISGIMRAAKVNLRGGDLFGGQGGSTITQQVIKNALLEPDKRITRKVKEAILALKLERRLTKEEILTYYLNESPYGGTVYGVEEAAQTFFGKSASDVSLAEAAYLAALPQAPTRLSPYGPNRHLLDNRQRRVLDRMLHLNFIEQNEYNNAIAEDVVFLTPSLTGIRAPHFVMYIKDILVEEFGEEALAEKGYRVITSIDYNLQSKAETIISEGVKSNTERFNASNAGMVAVDPQNGDVLVMVGSKNYFSETIDGNFNTTLAYRQPGSAIKPFIYANAFNKGYLPNTVVFDLKTQFSPLCAPNDPSSVSPCYSPNNYNGKFIGPVNLRDSLAQSLNIPAVKVLYLSGVNDSLKLASRMGITTLTDPDRYGLTLVLGGGEVKLLEITHGYGVFANDGNLANSRSILRIENHRGEIIQNFEPSLNKVLDTNSARMINDILSDNIARTPLFGSNSLIHFPDRDVAVKTGSTNNLVDAWVIGYTPNIAVGMWVGNNDPKPMGGGLSGLITTPMWREFMDYALEEKPVNNFRKPTINLEGVKPILKGNYVDINLITKKLETEETPTLDLNLLGGSIHNILHFVYKDNPNGPYPTTPQNDPQYNNWEWAVQQWREKRFSFTNTLHNEPAKNPENNDISID